MPRKHRRDEEHTPLDIAPEDIPAPPRRARRRWLNEFEWEEQRNERDRRRWEYRMACEAAERRKRVQAGMVPGCGDRTVRVPEWRRDVDAELPICGFHAVIVKQQIEPYWSRRDVVVERVRVQKHKDQVSDGLERAVEIAHNGNSAKGQIYFLRQNGLIKVGWSSNLLNRLKSYGPDVEILCHYPGSRQDETLMHRQLRPYLAKGREWFQRSTLSTRPTRSAHTATSTTSSMPWLRPRCKRLPTACLVAAVGGRAHEPRAARSPGQGS